MTWLFDKEKEMYASRLTRLLSLSADHVIGRSSELRRLTLHRVHCIIQPTETYENSSSIAFEAMAQWPAWLIVR